MRPRATLRNLDHRLHALEDRVREHGIILEEIRSQNRTILESLEKARVAARDSMLEAAIRQAAWITDALRA